MLKKIGLIIFAVFLAVLLLYAAPPTRALIQDNLIDRLGPPVAGGFEAASLAITNSWVWQQYSYFMAIGVGAGLMGFIAYFYHSGYNSLRRRFVASATREVTGGGGAVAPLAEPRTTTPSIAATRPEAPAPQPQPEPAKEEPKST